MSAVTETDSMLEDPDAMFAALWVVVGVMLLFVGRQSYGMLISGGLPGVVLVTQLFASGIGIVLLATTGLVDLRRWSRPLGLWVAYSLLALSVYNFWILSPGVWASDVSLFESWASHLILQGENPMAANMLAAESAWNVSGESANVTATTSGGVVSSYSYPGGTLVWSTIEQALLPSNRLGVFGAVASAGMMSWLTLRVDTALVPVATLSFLAPVLRPVSASLGMITPLWLFPLAVGLAAWYDDRLNVAAIGLGVAVASKQLAWPIAGLVLIHVLRTHGRKAAGRLTAISGGVAVGLVGWLVVWNPAAWSYSALSVFLPFGPELVAQGVGLTSLTVGGVTTVPRGLHTLLVLGVGGGLVGATWYAPDRMQWAVPFATALVLMVHYRTLPSYYAAAVPLAVLALDARLQTDRVSWQTRLGQLVGGGA